MRRQAAATLLVLAFAAPAAAQVGAPDPPGPFVIDLRGAVSGVPQDAAFYPGAPAGTIIPSRGFGFEVGGHVYLLNTGVGRLGIGASLLRVYASASPAVDAGAIPRVVPDIEGTFTAVAPQLSLNFGSREGWSYLSAGYGVSGYRSRTRGIEDESESNSTGLGTFNAGAGARWFMRGHLAVGFDVRFYFVGGDNRAAPDVSTPRSTLVAASVGISIR